MPKISRWMTVLLNEGKMARWTRMASAVQRQAGTRMWTAQTPMRIPRTETGAGRDQAELHAYGLGFQLRDYKGRKIAMHGGALQGFYSTVLMVPEEKLGIAILTNAENPAMAALYWRILDQYLKAAPSDWLALVAKVEGPACRRSEEAGQGVERARGEIAAVAAAGGVRRRV
jgi:CubicO group peptidase (beta-lactamase class C family)